MKFNHAPIKAQQKAREILWDLKDELYFLGFDFKYVPLTDWDISTLLLKRIKFDLNRFEEWLGRNFSEEIWENVLAVKKYEMFQKKIYFIESISYAIDYDLKEKTSNFL